MKKVALGKLDGFCLLHPETETEGGHWAFQDSRFITKNTTHYGCTKCYKYWNKEEHPNGPPEELNSAEPAIITRVIPINKIGDLISNPTLPVDCPPNEHDFQLISPENWSYDGLHRLKDGDWLIVYSKTEPKNVLWSGIIKLIPSTPSTGTIFKMFTPPEQEGVERKTWARWFIKSHPATLIPYKKNDASN